MLRTAAHRNREHLCRNIRDTTRRAATSGIAPNDRSTYASDQTLPAQRVKTVGLESPEPLFASEPGFIQQVIAVAESELRRSGRASASALSNAIRRQAWSLGPTDLGPHSLSRFLDKHAGNLVQVGSTADEAVWALGERLSDQELNEALAQIRVDGPTPQIPDFGAGRLAVVELHNFRTCTTSILRLATSGPTVLVGPNGAGKSTLLSGISFLSLATRGRLGALFSGSRDLGRLRSVSTGAAVEFIARTTKGVEFRLSGTPGDDRTGFQVRVSPPSGSPIAPIDWSSSGDSPANLLREHPIARAIWPAALLRFRPEALAAPSDVTEGVPHLGADGHGLASVLAHLANTSPERLQALLDGVRALVPSVRRTRQRTRQQETQPASDGSSGRGTIQYLFEVEMDRVGWIPADLLSEGTLFAFGMHAVLQQVDRSRILLMDDIDRAIHPRAQRVLIRQLKALAAEEDAPQIVVSTHSPYVLDELPPESVRIVRSGADGAIARALTDHPEWTKWADHMTAGEFWAYAGEDWLENAE